MPLTDFYAENYDNSNFRESLHNTVKYIYDLVQTFRETRNKYFSLVYPGKDASLMSAVRQNDTDSTHFYLNWGANPNATDYQGYGALQLAIFNENPEIALALALHGTDLNMIDVTGKPPLIEAVLLGDSEIATLILVAGGDVNIKGKHGITALMVAAANNDYTSAALLLLANASISDVNHNNMTACDFASQNNHHEMYAFLTSSQQDADLPGSVTDFDSAN